jgi:hypothetical protein
MARCEFALKKTMTGKGLVVSFTNICTKKFESDASNF